MVKRALLCCLLVAAAAWSAAATAAALTASVDRKQVAKNGYILLTLKLVNSNTRLRARGVSPNVDLTLLSDNFQVGVPHTKNRFNLYRGQGRSTSELEVELFPKRVGPATIPPFTVSGLSTKPITVLVMPAAKNPTPDVFVKSGVTKDTVWLREQTVAYLDLYYRVDLKDAQIGEHIDTDPQNVDLDKLPQAERKQTVGPFTYHVQRIGWALMPLHSGKLTVTLPEMWAQTATGGKFHSPQQKQVITVKPLPAGVPPLAIVGRPTLVQDMTQHDTVVNKLISWTITLKAATALNSLPDTLPIKQTPDAFKFYFDRPERRKDVRPSGMMSIAAYTVSAIPLRAGRFDLPSVVIPYFDPETGRMDSVKQPGVSLTIKTAAARDQTAEPPRRVQVVSAAPASGAVRYWQGAAGLFAALWLMTGALLWRRRGHSTPDRPRPAAGPRHPPGQPLKRALLDAFTSETLEEGLNDFERRHGVDAAVRATVRAVQRRYYSSDKEPARDPELEQAVADAARRIRRAASRQAPPRPSDPWSPRAFTATWRVTKSMTD